MSLLSQTGDSLVALIVGWPGVVLGLLVIVEWLERTFSRRRLSSSRTKLVVAAGVLIVGAITTRPDRSGPGDAARRRAQERHEHYAPDAAYQTTPEDQQRHRDADQRLKSEVESLRRELANEQSHSR